jgi:CheY-like chemotaxis protein
MKTVLVVDDCLDVLDAVAVILDDAGYNVVCTLEPQRAVQLCREINFDIVLCDLYMEGFGEQNAKTQTGGFDLIWNICDEFPKVPIIAMSGIVGEQELQQMKNSGVTGVLRKPFDRDQLLDEVLEAINTCPKPLAAAMH